MRVVIKFENGEYLNIPGDYIDVRDGWVLAYKDEYLVAACKEAEVKIIYITEKKEN